MISTYPDSNALKEKYKIQGKEEGEQKERIKHLFGERRA